MTACYDVNTLGQTCRGSVHRLEVDWSGRSALTCEEALNGVDVLCLGCQLAFSHGRTHEV